MGYEQIFHHYFKDIDDASKFHLHEHKELKDMLLKHFLRESKMKRILGIDIEEIKHNLTSEQLLFIDNNYKAILPDLNDNKLFGSFIRSNDVVKTDGIHIYKNIAELDFNRFYTTTISLLNKVDIFKGIEFSLLDEILKYRDDIKVKVRVISQDLLRRKKLTELYAVKLFCNYYFPSLQPNLQQIVVLFSKKIISDLYDKYKSTKIDSTRIINGRVRKELSTGIVYADTDMLHIRYRNEDELNELINKIKEDIHDLYDFEINKFDGVQYQGLKRYIAYKNILSDDVKIRGLCLV